MDLTYRFIAQLTRYNIEEKCLISILL